jgi:hypothetical protein
MDGMEFDLVSADREEEVNAKFLKESLKNMKETDRKAVMEELNRTFGSEFPHRPHQWKAPAQDEQQKTPTGSQHRDISSSQQPLDHPQFVEASDDELPSPISAESFSIIDGTDESPTRVTQSDQADPMSDWWRMPQYQYHGQRSGDYDRWENGEWTRSIELLPTAPLSALLTRTDLSILIAAVTYFLNTLQMIRRTIGDLYAPQDELEVASDTVVEGYQNFRRETDPILAKYVAGPFAPLPTTGLGIGFGQKLYQPSLPQNASIETWEGVRDVQLPPGLLHQLPPCTRCRRPGECVAGCTPLSKKSFATKMLECEKRRATVKRGTQGEINRP